MTLVNRLARPMLAAIFVVGGIDALRNPEARARLATPVIEPLTRRFPALPEDPVLLVKVNAAVHVVAGSLLAIGRLPRLSALALAGSLIPDTMAGHRFWEFEDAAQRAQQRTHLLKNAAIFGGLLTTAMQRRRRRRPAPRRGRTAATKP
ncbi:MAG: DoxX family protein [Candidatus Dormibacteria bacterium]